MPSPFEQLANMYVSEQVSQQIKERASQISSSLPEEQQEWLKKGKFQGSATPLEC